MSKKGTPVEESRAHFKRMADFKVWRAVGWLRLVSHQPLCFRHGWAWKRCWAASTLDIRPADASFLSHHCLSFPTYCRSALLTTQRPLLLHATPLVLSAQSTPPLLTNQWPLLLFISLFPSLRRTTRCPPPFLSSHLFSKLSHAQLYC